MSGRGVDPTADQRSLDPEELAAEVERRPLPRAPEHAEELLGPRVPLALGAVSPNRACSRGSPPVTMLSISRPPEIRWYVAAICAASTGLITPGRNATRNFSVDVSARSAAVMSQASSQKVPVGVSTPSKPSFSAVRAMSAR